MKALIITYYWPPAGGAGVHRWLKFTKYLRDYGIEPVLFIPENAHYPVLDKSLKEDIPKNIEVITCPIFEPNTFLSKFQKKEVGKSAGFLDENPSLIGRFFRYIRANYFIPDARMFWIKPSIKKLKKYLSENPIDVVITTGPPHSLHMIGLELKKKLGINWIADFRDPWTEIDYFHLLPLTNYAKKKHYRLENEVFKNADSVIMVSPTAKDKYRSRTNAVHIITNGYDDDDTDDKEPLLDKKFSIAHIGSMNSARNPKMLWKVLEEICNENNEFANDLEIKLIGKVDERIIVNEIKERGFKNLNQIDYIPHQEAKRHQKQSQVLLLVVNDTPNAKEIVTGKVFEYLQAKRPIVAIGPEDGDLANILNKTNAGVTFDYQNKKELKKEILSLYEKYKLDELKVASKDIEKYHRKKLTESLSIIIKELVK